LGLLERLTGREREPAERPPRSLAADARAMRTALGGIQAELDRVSGPGGRLDLRALVADLLEGEVEAPTADVVALVRAGVTPGEFYEQELRGSWEGLGEAQRAARIEGFMELSTMMDAPGAADDLPPDMVPRVRTKMLVLAWAFDETYGFISSLARAQGQR
jgi:hypothetical protein